MDTKTGSKHTLFVETNTIEKTKQKLSYQYSPIVESLAGIIPDTQEPDNAEYLKHLEEKY